LEHVKRLELLQAVDLNAGLEWVGLDWVKSEVGLVQLEVDLVGLGLGVLELLVVHHRHRSCSRHRCSHHNSCSLTPPLQELPERVLAHAQVPAHAQVLALTQMLAMHTVLAGTLVLVVAGTGGGAPA